MLQGRKHVGNWPAPCHNAAPFRWNSDVKRILRKGMPVSFYPRATKHIGEDTREHFADPSHADHKPPSALSPFVRVVTVCFGCALIVAAVGMWVVPSVDPAVHLLKLGASVLMFGTGAIALFMEKDARDPRRVEFDVAKRELRTFASDDTGKPALDRTYDLSSFDEVSLQQGVLFARDEENGDVVSVPLNGRGHEATIRKAIKLA